MENSKKTIQEELYLKYQRQREFDFKIKPNVLNTIDAVSTAYGKDDITKAFIRACMEESCSLKNMKEVLRTLKKSSEDLVDVDTEFANTLIFLIETELAYY